MARRRARSSVGEHPPPRVAEATAALPTPRPRPSEHHRHARPGDAPRTEAPGTEQISAPQPVACPLAFTLSPLCVPSWPQGQGASCPRCCRSRAAASITRRGQGSRPAAQPALDPVILSSIYLQPPLSSGASRPCALLCHPSPTQPGFTTTLVPGSGPATAMPPVPARPGQRGGR